MTRGLSKLNRSQRVKNKSKSVYTRTEQDKEPANYNWFKILLFLVFLIGAIYILIFSDFFKINDLEIKGYSHPETVEEVAEEMLSRNIFSRNIFFFNERELERVLAGDSQIYEVNVERFFPNSINILIEEAKAEIVWNTAGDNFLIDGRGVVMGLAKDEKLPVVSDASNINIQSGERVASPTFINFIKEINTEFEGSTETKISKIIILDILTDVHVLSSDGFVVYFDATKNASGQLKNLTRILEESRTAGSKLEYVDMRLDNKIFYK
jgi:cell division septal protein FtsQ